MSAETDTGVCPVPSVEEGSGVCSPTVEENRGFEYEIRSSRGTPTWEIAYQYPHQGDWSEEEYLRIGTNHLIEYDHGVLEFLPMPPKSHQALSRFLFRAFDQYVQKHRLGDVFYSPLPIRVAPKSYREPDLFYVKPGRFPDPDQPPTSVDLVLEIVSPGAENRNRDLVIKRGEYAVAKIPEYWIVDPETKTVHVLTLEGSVYRSHGEFQKGQRATSVLFPDFEIDVTSLFAAGEGQRG